MSRSNHPHPRSRSRPHLRAGSWSQCRICQSRRLSQFMVRRCFPGLPLILLTLLIAPHCALCADSSTDTNALWFAEHYTKYEHRIPMRDGVHLFTRVYVPKDNSEPWPIMFTRTPYSLKPYGVDNYTDPSGSFMNLARDQFILVTQDVRGRYGSEGEFVHVRPFNPNK